MHPNSPVYSHVKCRFRSQENIVILHPLLHSKQFYYINIQGSDIAIKKNFTMQLQLCWNDNCNSKYI